MSDTTICPACGALNQEIGKFCEQCGTQVPAPGPAAAPTTPTTPAAPTPSAPTPAATTPAAGSASTATLSQGTVLVTPDLTPGSDPRFVLVSGGALDMSRTFTVPRGSRLLLGRTDMSSDPARRTIPDVDVTPWAKRVQTSDGPLYTIHRRQCYLSADANGVVRIADYPDYPGDTLINPTGTADFRSVPDLASERNADSSGAIELRSGDRIIMGQAEGMLTFQLILP